MALALAVMASAVAYVGLHSAQQDADKNAQLASVYILKGSVPRGDSAGFVQAEGLIKATRIPRQFIPAGAVTHLSAIRDQVAQYDLPASEIITNAMFVAPAVLHSLAAQRVPRGDVAVSISTDLVHGVAGLIQPGDKADILVDFQGSTESLLYQSLPVLAVDTTLVSAPGKTSIGPNVFDQAKNVITFAVPPPTAAAIALADSGGGGASGLYLALSAVGNSSSSASIDGTTLVPGLPTIATSGGLTSGGHVSKSDSNDDHP